MKARILIETGRVGSHVFSKNGRTFGPLISFQSQALVRDLIKLGIFSMNLQSMANLGTKASGDGDDEEDPVPSFARAPAALLAMGFHYAIDVAPAEEGGEPGVRNVMIDALEGRVARIEEIFGPIHIDLNLVSRIATLAREMSLVPDGPMSGGYAG